MEQTEAQSKTLTLSASQKEAYLKRIGWAGDLRCDEETLSRLISAHQHAIPFETFTQRRVGTPPSLEIDDLFSKVITEKRGGYCFELNKLFCALLTFLGFDARPKFCRAVRGRDVRMPINHRATVVRIHSEKQKQNDSAYTEEYFVDVGFGGPMPQGALLLKDGFEQTISGETYIPCFKGDGWWNIRRETRAKADCFDDECPRRLQTELELCTANVEEQDFEALNDACFKPGTLFYDHDIANLRTENGHVSLMDDVLTIRENGNKHTLVLQDERETGKALVKYFGVA